MLVWPRKNIVKNMLTKDHVTHRSRSLLFMIGHEQNTHRDKKLVTHSAGFK
jgi:hypothetical protein